MFIFSTLISLNNKLVAYDFLKNSGVGDTAKNAGIPENSGTAGVTAMVGTVISVILAVIGVVFLGLTIYGGIMWMTAEGKEERIEKAKNIIIESVIGLVIVLAAYAISFFVISALTKG
jgi:hypothetical protein